jgi:D-alanine-D-alanine ligase
MAKPQVAVVFGGISNEHEISCLSANSILKQIDRDKYQIQPIGITKDAQGVAFKDELNLDKDGAALPEVDLKLIEKFAISAPTKNPPLELINSQVVFPVLHGPWGEDGTIQGLLELHKIPYVGSGVLASAIGMNKPLAKMLFRQSGLLVSNWKHFSKDEFNQNPNQVISEISQLSFPLFVKPARGGSSVGISKVSEPEQLAAAIESALTHDSVFLVEEAVTQAREIECGVLADVSGSGFQVSVPAEIKVNQNHEFYDYQAKYLVDGADLIVPAELTDQQIEKLQELSIKAFKSLNCEGLARVDFFLRVNGDIYLNEINTMPGFTPISMYPRVFAASGIAYPNLIEHLISEALNRSSGLR